MFRQKQVPVAKILAARIVINTCIRVEERGRELLIVIPRKNSRGMAVLSMLLVMPREKKIVLDELGHRVFVDCRKEWTVERIIAAFRERHGVSEEYARKSVLTYLDALARKGVIGFLIEEDKPAARGKGGGE